MRAIVPRVVTLLSLATGGGSLLLFFYFLVFGTPFPIRIVQSDTARLVWDGLLCFLFFIQHSGMIRRGARVRLAQGVPAVYYPAVYSIASGIVLYALVLFWQPTSQFVFHLAGPARWLSFCAVGLAMACFLGGVRALGRFDPFGILPLNAAARDLPPTSLVARGPYRYVRHPLYLAMLLLIWSTPRFTTDQLLFNGLWTAWIVVATRFEERDLLAEFGDSYRRYQISVPMLIPWPGRFRRQAP